jgi:hypothetical protein
MDVLRRLLVIRQVQIALASFAGMGIAAAVVAWKMGVDVTSLKTALAAAEGYLKLHPWALFCALVVLPGLPVPTSLLFLTAGVVWRERPLMACSLCLLALALNLTWTYWLAARPGTAAGGKSAHRDLHPDPGFAARGPFEIDPGDEIDARHPVVSPELPARGDACAIPPLSASLDVVLRNHRHRCGAERRGSGGRQVEMGDHRRIADRRSPAPRLAGETEAE